MDVIDKVRQLVSLASENDLAELEVEEEQLRILIKTGAGVQAPLPAPAPQVPASQEAPPAATAQTSAEQEQAPSPRNEEDLLEIVSPMVGTFYRSPSDGAEPYVNVGAIVDPESVVCIVEAMKVMNEVKAEVEGEIVEIMVQNAEPVEYGQVLFLVRPIEG